MSSCFVSSAVVDRPVRSVITRRGRLTASTPPPTHSSLAPTVSRRRLLSIAFVAAAVPPSLFSPAPSRAQSKSKQVSSVYDLSVLKNAKPLSLSFLAGKVTLFVNTASYCALTPQYEGLVSLHNEFQSLGFEIVASPSDQFRQEPESDEDVCSFVTETFGARFLLLDKLRLNDGPGGVAPLYHLLKSSAPETPGQRIEWNFAKFLVSSDGKVLRRYKPSVVPNDIRGDIQFAVTHKGSDLPSRKKISLGVE
jgi:glutathione peroxidase